MNDETDPYTQSNSLGFISVLMEIRKIVCMVWLWRLKSLVFMQPYKNAQKWSY